MTMPRKPTDEEEPFLATPGQVQAAGFYVVAVGVLCVVLGLKGWMLKGVLALHWFGIPLLGIGVFFIAKPNNPNLRERVGRITRLF